MTSRAVSLTTVAGYLRRRQRTNVAGLALLAPMISVLALLGAATFTLGNPLLGVVALAWPLAMVARIAARLVEDHGRVRRARALLARADAACAVRGSLLWVSAGADHASVALEHPRALAPPRSALPPARAVVRDRTR